jgi:hypothetical protein
MGTNEEAMNSLVQWMKANELHPHFVVMHVTSPLTTQCYNLSIWLNIILPPLKKLIIFHLIFVSISFILVFLLYTKFFCLSLSSSENLSTIILPPLEKLIIFHFLSIFSSLLFLFLLYINLLPISPCCESLFASSLLTPPFILLKINFLVDLQILCTLRATWEEWKKRKCKGWNGREGPHIYT